MKSSSSRKIQYSNHPGIQKVEVKGSKVTLKRGEETKTRAKNHIKVVEERPKELKTGNSAKKKVGPELDLEVSWNRIQAMGDQADAPVPQEEEEDLPALRTQKKKKRSKKENKG